MEQRSEGREFNSLGNQEVATARDEKLNPLNAYHLLGICDLFECLVLYRDLLLESGHSFFFGRAFFVLVTVLFLHP
jgi:hypothetical protein